MNIEGLKIFSKILDQYEQCAQLRKKQVIKSVDDIQKVFS